MENILFSVRDNIQKVLVGQERATSLMLTALVAGGHVLIEDVPGMGKTVLARSLAKSVDGAFGRVQFTPDLLPSDVTGLNFFDRKTGEFQFSPGPVFCNILLADEINRATPRTQSSLLECMAEGQVTVDGEEVAPQGYNINDNNYYKLRDIAYILSGTDSQFNVTWEAETDRILVTSGEAYQTVGGEMSSSVSTEIENCTPSDATVVIDGRTVSLTGYRINGNNYYKLRDIGEALDFSVDFDMDSRTVLISSAGSAQEEPSQTTNAVSYTFTGSGWGHSVGMSQWGAYGMAQQGFDYEEILKFYFTGIQIAG